MGSPVIFACSEQQAGLLAAPCEVLRREGATVTIAPGAEREPRGVVARLDEVPGEALLVVCEGGTMTPAIARQIEGLFSARRGPDHRILLLSFDAQHPMDVLAIVRDAQRSSHTALDRRLSASAGASGMRRVDRSRADRLPEGPGNAVEAAAREASRELAAVESALTRSAMHRARPSSSTARGTARSSGTHPLQAPPGSGEVPLQPEPVVAVAHADVAGAAAPAARGPWVFAVTAVALASVAAWLVLRRGDDAQARPELTAPRPRAEASLAVASPPVPAPAAAAGPVPVTPPTPTAAQIAPPEPSPAPLGAEEDLRVVSAALAAGQVHALDRLLWAAGDDVPQTYAGAAAACRGMSRGGVTGFRPPAKRELQDLRRARMLAPGVYWSATRVADAEGKVYALDTAAVPLLEHDTASATARVVCVRDRVPAADSPQ